ncbi:MAG: lipoate--protein ligase family protein [Dehalococcoidia bacterium]|nr:lipoate--protein ligase family protein [Dehalococcoidia bacterium]
MAGVKKWRLVISDRADGAANMALDEALMLGAVSAPTLRLYSWSPPCLSIGYSQRVTAEVDLEALARQSVGLVRRPSGGGAILHEQDITYCLVAPERHQAVSGSIVESYRKIAAGLVAGLATLGLTCQVAPGETRGDRSSACFEEPSAYELLAAGKKLVGSAQYRRGGVVLQHGSIPLSMDPSRILQFLRVPLDEDYGTRAGRFRNRAISLDGALNRAVSFDDACQALTDGFERALDVRFETGCLVSGELGVAARLRLSKYGDPTWTLMW